MNRPIQAILPRFKEGYKFENIEQKGFLYDADSTYVYAAKMVILRIISLDLR